MTTLKAAASWILPFAAMFTAGPLLVVAMIETAVRLGPAAPLAFMFSCGLIGLAYCGLIHWLNRSRSFRQKEGADSLYESGVAQGLMIGRIIVSEANLPEVVNEALQAELASAADARARV